MGLVFAATAAEAAVIRIPAAAFTPAAGLITFSEFANGTVNPVYTPAVYGGGAGAPTVTFEGGFLPGSDPLALNPAAGNTFITGDGANPTSPVLSGTPLFNGPIAVLFSVDVAGVGLDAGFFDAIGGTAIEAFDRHGNSLGSVLNVGLGIEFLGLVTDDGTEQIAGLLFHIVGNEPAGYAIDNLRFGLAGQVTPPNAVPEPGTLLLLGSGCAYLARRRRQRRNA
jgi:hypothetical protein